MRDLPLRIATVIKNSSGFRAEVWKILAVLPTIAGETVTKCRSSFRTLVRSVAKSITLPRDPRHSAT